MPNMSIDIRTLFSPIDTIVVAPYGADEILATIILGGDMRAFIQVKTANALKAVQASSTSSKRGGIAEASNHSGLELLVAWQAQGNYFEVYIGNPKTETNTLIDISCEHRSALEGILKGIYTQQSSATVAPRKKKK